ncbi:UDP-N-acetylglucosamine transferase subunit ALG14 [Sphingomonas palmae]|nr:UDP-N-acetylglucosamine transferase subunit ALG14 [Sphingomonas palmae]
MSKRVLAIASAGGHWDQMMRLRTAFVGHQVTFVTTRDGVAQRAGVVARLVPDCNRHERLRVIACAARLALLILRRRPQVIVTTGALPGVIGIALGRAIGARTLWIDSIANGEQMSLSGRRARTLATQCLSQWPDVAATEQVGYSGAVL